VQEARGGIGSTDYQVLKQMEFRKNTKGRKRRQISFKGGMKFEINREISR